MFSKNNQHMVRVQISFTGPQLYDTHTHTHSAADENALNLDPAS